MAFPAILKIAAFLVLTRVEVHDGASTRILDATFGGCAAFETSCADRNDDFPLMCHPPSLDAVIDMQEIPLQKRFLVGCSSPFIRLAQHLTALRA